MTWPGRQLVVAAALGGAGLLVVVMATRVGVDSEGTAPSAASTRTPATGEPAAVLPVTDLRLDLLESPRVELGEPARNPFRFQARPAPPAPRSAAPPPAAATSAPRAAVPSGPPPLPPIPLRFIGLFDAPGQAGRVAIMSDGRGNVFYGKEGDIIEGRYRVLRVGADVAELAYVDGRGRQTIRLSGQ